MAIHNPSRASRLGEKWQAEFFMFVVLASVLLFCFSCKITDNGDGEPREPNEPIYEDTYYRPFSAMMQAVTTVLKKNHIPYEVNPSMEGIINADAMGKIEVKRLDSCETRVMLEPQASKSHPLNQRFFYELDRVLAGLSPAPPSRSTEEFPKKMVIQTKSGGTANIRSDPRIGKNIIAKLPCGTEVSAFEKKGDWYHIVFGSGQRAWAHKIVLK